MSTPAIFGLLIYIGGVWASYISLKGLVPIKIVRLLAILSWLTYISYLLAVLHDNAENNED